MTNTNLEHSPTSGTPRWRLVAQREIGVKAKDKSFLITTAVMLVIVLAAVVIPHLAGGGSATKVAVADATGARVVATAATTNASGQKDLTPVREPDAAAARNAVEHGDAKLALVAAGNGYEVIGKSSIDSGLRQRLAAALTQDTVSRNAERAGTTIGALSAGSTLTDQVLHPGPLSQTASYLIGLGMGLAFYMTCILFGITIAQSVLQEKESRVVEILAAAVPIRSLLWGKILGNALMALAQIVLIAAAALAGLAITGGTGVLGVVAPVAPWYVVFFVLGFLALSSLWAVGGSLASRNEDLQSTTMPFSSVLLVGYLVAVFGKGTLQVIASYVPILSSMSMPIRIVNGQVGWWQPLVSLAILIVSTVLLVRLGARAYTRTLLRTGRKLKFREAFGRGTDPVPARSATS